MVLTRGRRRQQAQQQDEEERAAQLARRERIRWVNGVFTKAPVHHLGHFLDRFDFAALQTTSATMQTSLRNVIRARNLKLPAGQRMGNLGGEFCVCEAHKELLRREGRQPADIIATGGRQGFNAVSTVMSSGDEALHDPAPDNHSSKVSCHGEARAQALRHGGHQ